MLNSTAIPLIPPPLALPLRFLPLLPLHFVLQRAAEGVRSRKPDLFARLEGHADKVFLIDLTDLPFVFCVSLNPDHPSIEPRRREQGGEWDARIAGLFAALIGMVHGSYDGDALFFSRDIVIEGDTEAVLALRNALDDAEIDLPAEIAAAFGLSDTFADRLARRVFPVMSRITGFSLARDDGAK
jgi:predicted lipid carrier protein YhbT